MKVLDFAPFMREFELSHSNTVKQDCEFSVKELKSNGLLSLIGSDSCFSFVRTIF